MSRDVGDRDPGSSSVASGSDPGERHATLANAVADGLFQVDGDDRFAAVNDAFVDVTDCSREELLGEPLDRAFPSAAAERLSAARRGLDGSDPDAVTLSLSADDGEGSFEVRLRAVEDGAAGSVRRIDASRANATTERYADALDRTEARLHEETEKFRSLVDAVEEYAIFMLDPDGRITSWNEGAARIKGYDASEVLGEHFSIFYTDEDRAEGVPGGNLDAADEAGQVTDEGWRVRADGSRFWANVVITPIYDGDDLVGYAKVTRDMTDRREREQALQRERDLVERILEANPVGIAVLDTAGEFTRLNRTGADILGVDPADAADLDPDDWTIYDEDGDRVPPAGWPQSRALRTGEAVYDWRCEIERHDGSRRWLSANAVPLLDDAGAVERVILTANDITSLKDQQADLRRERDLMNHVLDASPAGIALVDRDGSFARINDTASKFLGIDEDEADEYTAQEWTVYDEDGDRVPADEQAVTRAFETGESTFDWRIRVEGKDGVDRWLSVNAVPLFDDGAVEQVVVTSHDITDITEQREQLRRERDLTQRILDTSPIGIAVLTNDLEIEHVNARGQDILGIDTPVPEMDEGGTLYDEAGNPLPPEERPSVRVLATGEPVEDWQCQYEHPDGERRWLSINATPVFGDDGEVERIITAGDDITTLKEQARQLERRRDELERELGEVFERIDDGFYGVDEEFRFTYVNERAEQLLQREESELLGRSVWDVFPEAAETSAWESFHEALETQEPTSYETYFESLDLWVKANVYPSETGLSVYFEDVTERKERERELEEFETIVETVNDGIFTVDSDGVFTHVNDAYASMLGYEPGELIGRPAESLAPTGTTEEGKELHRQLIEGEANVAVHELELPTANDETVPVEARFKLLPSGDGEQPGTVAVVRDVTGRKERERALEESEQRYRTLAENFPNGAVGVYDHDLRYTLAAGSSLGETLPGADELEGDRMPEIFPEATAADLEPVFRAAVEDGETASTTTEFGGRNWQVWATPLRDADGEIFAGLSFAQDITERVERERELERTLDLLERTERIADIGGWEIDTNTMNVFWSDHIFELLEVPGDEEPPLEEALEMYHEEDQPIVEGAVEDALATGESFEVETRVRTEDGDIRWLRLQGVPETTDGDVVSLRGAAQDITERVERERALERYEAIVETVDDGIYVVDEDGQFTMVNDEYASMAGYDREELVGQHVTDVVEEDVARRARELETEMLSGERESASLEAEMEAEDGETVVAEATFTLLRSDDGDSVRIGVVRDVTERKERERALEESERRYRTLAENFPNGAVALFDEDLRYTAAGGQLFDLVDTDRDDPIGTRITERYPPDLVEEIEPHFRAALDGEANSFEAELQGWHLHAYTLPVRNADDEVFAGMVVVQNVTELREHERALQTRIGQQEAVTDLGQQALEERDLDALFDEVTDCVADVLDADYCKVLELLPDGEEVLLRSGVGWQDGLVGEATVGTGLDSQAGYTLRTEEPVVVDDLATETRFSGPDLLVDHDVTSGISTVIGPPEDPWGVLGVHATDERDFSEHDVNFVQSVATILATAIQRGERERELERYETIVETIWDGVYALDPDGNFELVNDAFCEMMGYDREDLLGEPGRMVHDADIDETAARLSDEIAAGERDSAVLELELETADGGTVPVESQFGPYAYDEERYGRTGVTRDVTERLARERALERQREELAALNRLNQVVGEITHAAVESSSREEIERLVCERLADSESYRFAWIGETDRTTGTVAMRTEAGVEGYLDDVTIAIDPEEGHNGPTSRAVRTQEPQITQDIQTDADYEPWREHASEHGFRSSAAIPIAYEDVLYGVLNVYSARVGAFDDYERTLLSRLGNVVGHTINALERKEALMSDQVVEIDVAMPDVVSYVDGPVPGDGTIAFERTVAVDDGTFLEYGTVDEAGLETLELLVESLPFWEEVSVLDERFGEISFELRLSEPPAISTVASYGGRVQEAVIEDGDYGMVLELPPTADVRAVVEALQVEYPALELTAQRRTTREAWTAGRIDAVLEERLTDRQRATMEAAYYAGYFDTPRKRNGEEVADSLGITAPTLHQHLRKAQRKLLAAVLDGSEETFGD